jgi:hypothetical protein
MPPRGASELVKREHEAKFNLRARWRMVRHSGPGFDGATRGVVRSALGFCERRRSTRPCAAQEGLPACCRSEILTKAGAIQLQWVDVEDVEVVVGEVGEVVDDVGVVVVEVEVVLGFGGAGLLEGVRGAAAVTDVDGVEAGFALFP